MCYTGILVERRRRLVIRPPDGLMRFGELMLHSYVFLDLKLLHEDAKHLLLNSILHTENVFSQVSDYWSRFNRNHLPQKARTGYHERSGTGGHL